MLIEEAELAGRVAPALLGTFLEHGVMELESGGAPALAGLFREHGLPGLLVPRALGGGGGSLLQVAQLLRLVGARCPSLSIMMTMHHHSVAAFASGSIPMGASGSFLQRVAGQGALVSSAFAEGRPGAEILDSTVQCRRREGEAGFRIAGSKKPCSMAHHSDYAVVGVAVELAGGRAGRGIALVDRRLPGIRSEAFWPAELFAAADSHGLVFDDVAVPESCVLAPEGDGNEEVRARFAVAHAEIALSCLFQLMVSASYLGMATRLCEMTLQRRGGTGAGRVEMLSRLEAAAMAVYRLAEMLEGGSFSGHLLARSMLVAHNAGAQIERVASDSARALGGGGYLASKEAQYLVLACRCIHFHPPSGEVREEIVDGCYTDLADA